MAKRRTRVSTDRPENGASVIRSKSREVRCRRWIATAVPPMSLASTLLAIRAACGHRRRCSAGSTSAHASISAIGPVLDGAVEPAPRRSCVAASQLAALDQNCDRQRVDRPCPRVRVPARSSPPPSSTPRPCPRVRIPAADEGLSDVEAVCADPQIPRRDARPEAVPELRRHPVVVLLDGRGGKRRQLRDPQRRRGREAPQRRAVPALGAALPVAVGISWPATSTDTVRLSPGAEAGSKQRRREKRSSGEPSPRHSTRCC